jgi:hypothetical protein
VKIGMTTQEDANARIAQLYATGVPVPFELRYACKVANPAEVEKALHIAFAPHRINPKREFFKIEADQAIAILKLLHTEDATAEVAHQPTGLDTQSIEAGEKLRARRPNMNFVEMGIPIGAKLQSTHGDPSVVVVSEKKVLLGQEEMSLTAATRKVFGTDYSVQPSPHWTYNGKLLDDIYEETYGADE